MSRPFPVLTYFKHAVPAIVAADLAISLCGLDLHEPELMQQLVQNISGNAAGAIGAGLSAPAAILAAVNEDLPLPLIAAVGTIVALMGYGSGCFVDHHILPHSEKEQRARTPFRDMFDLSAEEMLHLIPFAPACICKFEHPALNG